MPRAATAKGTIRGPQDYETCSQAEALNYVRRSLSLLPPRERKFYLPDLTPRYVRVYSVPQSYEYVAVFGGRYKRGPDGFDAISVNMFTVSVETFQTFRPYDVNDWGWPPAVGRKCHIGTRIDFFDAPALLRRVAYRHHTFLWDLCESTVMMVFQPLYSYKELSRDNKRSS